MPGQSQNYAEIQKDKLDAWGIPTLKIHCEWGENERAMSKDIAVQAAEMLAAAGREISPCFRRCRRQD